MSTFQRFMCATTAASTVRRSVCKTPDQTFCCLQRLNSSTLTSASTNPKDSDHIKSTQTTANSSSKKSDWSVVYRLPLIRWASAFNRLKVYQGVVTVAGIPTSFILEQAEVLSPGASVVFGAVGISGIITLALSSLVVKNLIGFIYINRDANQLKFAYVDYWGRRQDTVVHIDDVIPDGAQDKPSRVNFYQNISLQNNEKLSFKLLQRYGVIVQPEIFGSLFY